MKNIWQWLRDNDIPNWVTSVAWPVFLYWITRLWIERPVNNVPCLEVAISHYCDNPPEALIKFRNKTDSAVYLTKAGIRCSKSFPVRADATRDIVTQICELKFGLPPNFTAREVLIPVNGEVTSGLGLDKKLSDEILNYTPSYFQQALGRIFSRKKYYILEYVAVVGTRKYKVRTIK